VPRASVRHRGPQVAPLHHVTVGDIEDLAVSGWILRCPQQCLRAQSRIGCLPDVGGPARETKRLPELAAHGRVRAEQWNEVHGSTHRAAEHDLRPNHRPSQRGPLRDLAEMVLLEKVKVGMFIPVCLLPRRDGYRVQMRPIRLGALHEGDVLESG